MYSVNISSIFLRTCVSNTFPSNPQSFSTLVREGEAVRGKVSLSPRQSTRCRSRREGWPSAPASGRGLGSPTDVEKPIRLQMSRRLETLETSALCSGVAPSSGGCSAGRRPRLDQRFRDAPSAPSVAALLFGKNGIKAKVSWTRWRCAGTRENGRRAALTGTRGRRYWEEKPGGLNSMVFVLGRVVTVGGFFNHSPQLVYGV